MNGSLLRGPARQVASPKFTRATPLRPRASASSSSTFFAPTVPTPETVRQLTLSSPASRKYKCQLPPTDERETKAFEYAPGLFVFEQALGVSIFNAGLRMTVVDLGNDELWVHAPVARTEELVALFEQVGRGKTVRHIVIPNTSPEHSYFAAEWAAACPQAQVWHCPGFDRFLVKAPEVDRLVKSGVCRALSDQAPAEWNGLIEIATFRAGGDVPLFCECAFYLNPYRAVTFCDTAFAAFDDFIPNNPVSRFLAQTAGVYQQVGTPFTRPLFQQYKAEAQLWVARVLAWDWEVMVPAHASGPVFGAKEQFRRAFEFVGPVQAV